jgi:hypothetical protein
MTVFERRAFTIVREGDVPNAPPSLDETGATLWRSILAQRRITSAAELVVLENACQCFSRAESLRRIISVEGELIETGDGGFKANGLLTIELTARALCSRLLGQLRASEDRPKMGRPPNQKPSF